VSVTATASLAIARCPAPAVSATAQPHEARGASRRLPLADGRNESTKDERRHVDGQGVGDHGQQQASAAVANEHHGSGGLCGCGTHGLRYVTPLRRGGAGDPEQRGDDSLPPAPRKHVGDRQPGRGSDERAVD
jgi:hypothetical protein